MSSGPAKVASEKSFDARRKARRWKTGHLKCSLGRVVDISAAGMCVRCPARPPVRVGQVFKVSVESSTQKLPVTAQAQWIRRRGLRRHDVGVSFLNVNPGLAEALEALGALGFVSPQTLAAATEEPRPSGSEVHAELELPDYYEVLGIRPTATHAEVRNAYRDLVKMHHPVVADSPEDNRMYAQITEAYEALREPSLRRAYDRQLFGEGAAT